MSFGIDVESYPNVDSSGGFKKLSLRSGGADHLYLPTQPRLVPVSRIDMNGPFFNGFIDQGKSLRKKAFG